MTVFNEPQKWAQTLGKDADVTTIPDTSGETDPSIDKIFPAVFSIPLAQGGKAIPRSVLNGLFKLLGDWSFYQQNGGFASYSADFNYTVGRVVLYNNNIYKCIQDNDASSPKAPTETAYWSKITTLADVANAFANQSFSNVNDNANILMAHNAMPSNVYDDLTAPQSAGTTYTATADGWLNVFATASSSGGGSLTVIVNNLINIKLNAEAYGVVSFLLPLKKGDSFWAGYNPNFTVNYFRFIYAVGSQSEQ